MTKKRTVWTKKDLLALEDLSTEEIELILDTARSFRQSVLSRNPNMIFILEIR